MADAPSWLWIPVVLCSAVAQTTRNAAQRSLTSTAGTMGATLVRFLYGLPFSLAWVGVMQVVSGEMTALPHLTGRYIGWLLLGALAQASATALLVASMHRGNFVIAVTYSKTEVLQVAFLGALLLHEVPTGLAFLAMTIAVIGVVLLAAPSIPFRADTGLSIIGPVAVFGLGAGSSFALAVIAYRIAGLEFMRTGPYSAWYVGGWTVLLAQLLQTAVICAWMACRSKTELGAVFSSWRVSGLAGLAGAVASITGVVAYILQAAADVRALSMIEVVLSYAVSKRFMHEQVSRTEQLGLILVMAGVVCVCLGAG